MLHGNGEKSVLKTPQAYSYIGAEIGLDTLTGRKKGDTLPQLFITLRNSPFQ